MSDEFTAEQQEQYEKDLAEYKPTGFFANRQVHAFKPYVKDGALDAESAKKDWGLNDRQLPFLTKELEAAGILPEPPEAVAPQGASDPNKPLSPPLASTPAAGPVPPKPIKKSDE